MTSTETAAREYVENLYPIKDFKNIYNWYTCCIEHANSFAAGAEYRDKQWQVWADKVLIYLDCVERAVTTFNEENYLRAELEKLRND